MSNEGHDPSEKPDVAPLNPHPFPDLFGEKFSEQLRTAFQPSEEWRKRLSESLAPLRAQNAVRDALGRTFAGIDTEALRLQSKALENAIGELRIDALKVKPLPEPAPLRVPPPVRPVADVRLEQVVNALERLTSVAMEHNKALLAIDEGMEARHIASEAAAGARAERQELKATWNLIFAAIAAIAVVIPFLWWLL